MLGVGKVASERNVACLVIEVGFDRSDRSGVRKLVAVGQDKLDLDIVFIWGGFVLQIASFGDVKVSLHRAVVGQGGKHVAFFD